MPIAAAGDRGVLITMPDATAEELSAAAETLRARDGVEACIVGHESVLVVGLWSAAAMPPLLPAEIRAAARPPHSIRVSFAPEYAPDLTIPRDALLHRKITLSVRFLGFRPGFAYCDGWPEEWRMPRRATSRNVVPRGSFAIAGAFAGFYAVDSPGGWNIIGRTAAPLWDPEREPPNLFAPGDAIEIVPTLETIELAPPRPRTTTPPAHPIADVIAPGQLTSIVAKRDWSRAEHGLTPGGPFDADAATVANRAAGNAADAPLLECVLVGPKLRFREAARAAWCGGDGVPRLVDIRAGEELDIGRFHAGLRGYLAIAGGIDAMAPKYAESPVVLRRGGVIGSADLARVTPRLARAARGERQVIRVMRGPNASAFEDSDWEVTPQLDRTGIRLRPMGDARRDLPADLPSCGMQFGTVQWHPDGSLIVMGPDHPVTGGYLQPATVVSSELWKLAQLAPGERVRLVCG